MNRKYLAHVTAWLAMTISLVGMILLAGAGIAQRLAPIPGLAALVSLFIVGYLASRLADATEDWDDE